MESRIKFKGSSGELLDARLDLPEGRPIACAIFAHCFSCSKDLIAAVRISKALTNHKIAVFRFDFTGLGKSEGEFSETNFSSNVDDILLAVDYMRQKMEAPKILIGHSLGGTAILAAAGKIPEAVAIATIGSPSTPEHVIRHFEEKIPEIMEKGKAEVKLGERSLQIKKQFVDDVIEQDVLKSLSNLNKALMIFHSPSDSIVDIENAREIYEAARHPKSFISLDKADHLLTNKRDAIYVADLLAAWASRYVDEQT